MDAKIEFVKSPTTATLTDLIENELYNRLPDDVGLFLSSKSPYFNDRDIRKELADEDLRRRAKGDDNLREIFDSLPKSDQKTIPNVVHYIWFGCRDIRIHHFLSFTSALKIQQPDYILFHTDCPPGGALWNDFTQHAGDKLKIVKRSSPEHVWGIPLVTIEHKSDIARIQILLEVGGIYADDDLIFLKVKFLAFFENFFWNRLYDSYNMNNIIHRI